MMTNAELFDACKAAGVQEAKIREAASDMLEALKSADASFAQLFKLNRLPAGENNAGWRDVRNAIAKATGQ